MSWLSKLQWSSELQDYQHIILKDVPRTSKEHWYFKLPTTEQLVYNILMTLVEYDGQLGEELCVGGVGVHVGVCLWVWVCACLCVGVCVCMCVCMCLWVWVCLWVSVWVWVCLCVSVCVCVCTHGSPAMLPSLRVCAGHERPLSSSPLYTAK